jgi:hypothetical protein
LRSSIFRETTPALGARACWPQKSFYYCIEEKKMYEFSI